MGFAAGDKEAKKVFGLKPHAIDKGTHEAARIFGMRHRAGVRHMIRHRCGPKCLHMSVAARRFIARKIEIMMREGVPQRQAVAIAYSMARRRGYHVPRRS